MKSSVQAFIYLLFWFLPIFESILVFFCIEYPLVLAHFLPQGAEEEFAKERITMFTPIFVVGSLIFCYTYQWLISIISKEWMAFFLLILLQTIALSSHFCVELWCQRVYSAYLVDCLYAVETIPYFILVNGLVFFLRLRIWDLKTSNNGPFRWNLLLYCLPIGWCGYELILDLLLYFFQWIKDADGVDHEMIFLSSSYVILLPFSTLYIGLCKLACKFAAMKTQTIVVLVLPLLFCGLTCLGMCEFYIYDYWTNMQVTLLSTVYVLPFFTAVSYVFWRKLSYISYR